MKKITCIVLAAILLFALAACGGSSVKVDLGKSELYAKEDLERAEKLVEKTIGEMEGTTIDLKSVTYKGDERSASELEYVNSLERGVFDECAVFGSLFHTSKDATGAWEPDADYTWEFFLARADGGDWEVVTFGY